jgi:glyceraldehyde-3-phosphate dehydrogenase/erythrose-4-phosphate dehydrogenase
VPAPLSSNLPVREVPGTGGLAGVLRYSTDPLVSRDTIGDPASCVFGLS